MSKKEKFNGWIASLSNGETIFERPMEKGKLSPWQDLLKWLRENPSVHMTMLRLQINGITIMGMKNANGYLQCIQYFKSVFTGKEKLKRGIGSVFGNIVVMNWIDEDHNIWTEQLPLKEYLLHSTVYRKN
jgi:hypothetical protein